MAITSADIQQQSFKIERRGYDVDEVDVFLERVASEIDDLNNQVARLKEEAASAPKQEPAKAAEEPVATKTSAADAAALAAKDAKIADLEKRLSEQRADDNAIAQALIIAQRTADEIVSKAKGEAEQTRQNAEEEAQRILDKANDQKQKVIDHINELSASREQVREQYQDMLKDFIGVASKRLAEIGGEVTAGIELPEEVKNAAPATDAKISVDAAKWNAGSAVSTYTTPTVSPVVSAPATPKPSAAAKDFSGYGDADDSFAFDEID